VERNGKRLQNAGVAKSVEEAMSKRCSILIVEDDALVGKYLASILAGAGIDPIGPFSTVGGALDAIRTCIFDAGFLDIVLALAQELCALSLRGIDWVSPPREEVMAPLEVRRSINRLGVRLPTGQVRRLSQARKASTAARC
jgi:DNA-binding NarL/FixJ family response regulator